MLNQVKDIYADMYGQADKKVIQIKRQIVEILLKFEDHSSAIKELFEIEEMENMYFGEGSVDVAKTQKVIGSTLILTQRFQEAVKYLQKALRTFEDNGMKKAVVSVRE